MAYAEDELGVDAGPPMRHEGNYQSEDEEDDPEDYLDDFEDAESSNAPSRNGTGGERVSLKDVMDGIAAGHSDPIAAAKLGIVDTASNPKLHFQRTDSVLGENPRPFKSLMPERTTKVGIEKGLQFSRSRSSFSSSAFVPDQSPEAILDFFKEQGIPSPWWARRNSLMQDPAKREKIRAKFRDCQFATNEKLLETLGLKEDPDVDPYSRVAEFFDVDTPAPGDFIRDANEALEYFREEQQERFKDVGALAKSITGPVFAVESLAGADHGSSLSPKSQSGGRRPSSAPGAGNRRVVSKRSSSAAAGRRFSRDSAGSASSKNEQTEKLGSAELEDTDHIAHLSKQEEHDLRNLEQAENAKFVLCGDADDKEAVRRILVNNNLWMLAQKEQEKAQRSMFDRHAITKSRLSKKRWFLVKAFGRAAIEMGPRDFEGVTFLQRCYAERVVPKQAEKEAWANAMALFNLREADQELPNGHKKKVFVVPEEPPLRRSEAEQKIAFQRMFQGLGPNDDLTGAAGAGSPNSRSVSPAKNIQDKTLKKGMTFAFGLGAHYKEGETVVLDHEQEEMMQEQHRAERVLKTASQESAKAMNKVSSLVSTRPGEDHRHGGINENKSPSSSMVTTLRPDELKARTLLQETEDLQLEENEKDDFFDEFEYDRRPATAPVATGSTSSRGQKQKDRNKASSPASRVVHKTTSTSSTGSAVVRKKTTTSQQVRSKQNSRMLSSSSPEDEEEQENNSGKKSRPSYLCGPALFQHQPKSFLVPGARTLTEMPKKSGAGPPEGIAAGKSLSQMNEQRRKQSALGRLSSRRLIYEVRDLKEEMQAQNAADELMNLSDYGFRRGPQKVIRKQSTVPKKKRISYTVLMPYED